MSKVVWSKNYRTEPSGMQHNNDTQKHQLVQKPPGFTQIFLAWEKVRPVHCKVLCGLSVLISTAA